MVLAVETDNTAVYDVAKRDIKEEFYRASGAGGQHRNKTSSAVRLTHVPTNLVAISADERSQHQNREIAFKRLQQRVQEHYASQQNLIEDELRQAQLKLDDAWVWTSWRDEVKTPAGRKASMKKTLKGNFSFLS